MQDSLIRKIKSIWNGLKRIKPIKYRFANGYISMMGMIVFFVVLQTVSLMAVYSMSSSCLIKADRQNIFDLSVISHARHMIENNQYVERCHLPDSYRIVHADIIVDDIAVSLEDHITYITCSYETDYPIEMRIYYDAHQIIGYEIQAY